MPIFDTHCHYNLEPLAERWQDAWAQAQAAGVTHSIIVGTNAESSRSAVALANAHPNLFAAVAMHPCEWNEPEHIPADWQNELMSLAAHPKVIAIGETGLDFFHSISGTIEGERTHKEPQLQSFRWHIQLANRVKKPLLLHVRATSNVSETQASTSIFEMVLDTLVAEHSTVPFVFHCFSGSIADAQRAIDMGGYIGVAGNITYKNADPLRQVIAQLPPHRILSETDAPYLAPVPFRGKSCEPYMIVNTVETASSLLQVPPETFHTNALNLFTPFFPNKVH